MALQYWKAITLWSLLKGVNNLQIKESHCADAGALPRSHFVTEHTEKLILKINLKPTDRIHHHVGQITTHHRFPLVGFSRRVGSIRCPYHRGFSDTSAGCGLSDRSHLPFLPQPWITDYWPAIPALSLLALDQIGRNVYVFRYPYFFRKPLFADTDRYTVARNHHTFWWFVTDFELDISGVGYR